MFRNIFHLQLLPLEWSWRCSVPQSQKSSPGGCTSVEPSTLSLIGVYSWCKNATAHVLTRTRITDHTVLLLYELLCATCKIQNRSWHIGAVVHTNTKKKNQKPYTTTQTQYHAKVCNRPASPQDSMSPRRERYTPVWWRSTSRGP